jgi:uncharacterized protein YjbI with pentapeptide repeats
VFTGSTFRDDVKFVGTEFREGLQFHRVEFEKEAKFPYAEFYGFAQFQMAEFNEETIFTHSKFYEGPNFADISLESANFGAANLSEASFIGTNLNHTILEEAILSRATLFDADLRGAKLSGAVLGDVRLDEDTKFLGHPTNDSDTSPHTISAIRSRPTCVYDPSYEEDNEHADMDKAKSVYRALEELAGKAARTRLQARCFVRRQDLQKKEYWDVATNSRSSLEERLIAGARWSRARTAELVLLYGESPWRIIAWSLGIVTLFALLYPSFGLIELDNIGVLTWDAIRQQPSLLIDSFYFSTITYTALELGGFSPVRGWGQIATIIESGLGVVLLALLVFVLGRRAAR